MQRSRPGEPFSLLGRRFEERDGKVVYYLDRWNNSLAKIVEKKLADHGLEFEKRLVDQLRSFRYENRFDTTALQKLDEVIAFLAIDSSCNAPAIDGRECLGPMSK